MRRPRLSAEERKNYLRQIDKSSSLNKRKRKLYNRKYRKSLIFISSWILRLIYIFLFVIVLCLYYKSDGIKKEILHNKKTETYTSSGRNGTRKGAILHFETNVDKYSINVTGARLPEINQGDTLLIERNIFNKPIYFTKANWYLKYCFDNNLQYYYLVLFITVISLFFNDGLDRFTHKLLWIVWTLDIISIIFYFLI